MKSLYDELADKISEDPRLTRRGGPRVDLSVLLFNSGDDLKALWVAAEREVSRARRAAGPQDGESSADRPEAAELAAAVERLRPIFGERTPR